MKPQENFIKESYDHGKYKLTWMFIVTFSALYDYLYILHVFYKQLSSPFNDGYVVCIYTN
jgi:hypothetical protein